MTTPDFREDSLSTIPALHFLQNIGYTYLSPDEVNNLRGGKLSAVILEPILKKQLRSLNSISYKGNTYSFSDKNIDVGITAIKQAPLQEGLITANEHLYGLLTQGKSLRQTIKGDQKSYDLRYINWDNWAENTFHVASEFAVRRTASHQHYVPDIVLFVNGIPLVVIECKSSNIKSPLEQAISQHLRNQQEDGIRLLYAYSQVVMALATNVASYATTATKAKFWGLWREQFVAVDKVPAAQNWQDTIVQIKHQPLTKHQKDKLFLDRYAPLRTHFEQLTALEQTVTEQDKYLYGICRPERLLDLIANFIVYDAHIKKIARYQQYFTVKQTIERIRYLNDQKRQGGVIWHTQGSGKSLTMVLLARAIRLNPHINNPKIVIVTDRVSLDNQISDTFRKCKIAVLKANTGSHLSKLLEGKSNVVVTTVINKFMAAAKKIKHTLTSPNIFVLIDEAHRTQYGTFSVHMQKTFPNACFIAFTGTPLRKKEKNTAQKFGGIIQPAYTIQQAVEDRAIVPLLYEGRHANQEVNDRPIDRYFSKVSEPLNDYQKSDLKKKFSRSNQLNIAEQKIEAIAWNISEHFLKNSDGTDWKAQLVCQNKATAIRYKNYFDEIGKVSTEVLISPPDMREGEDSPYEDSKNLIKRFWKGKMDEFGGKPQAYDKHLINRFKYHDEPQIIIVVDKLLTGFDAPRNTFLYITRSLKEHTLLQAIARVNRVHSGKDYGFVIDYYGVLKELDEALSTYSDFQEFDAADLAFTMTNIAEEVKKLPQAHSELWDIFKKLPNKYDEPAYEERLSDEAERVLFYEKLSKFARLLKLALSSMEWQTNTPDNKIQRYKDDLGFFAKLRLSVRQRFADVVDFKSYEKQIQRLIDKHVTSHEVHPITDLVNIFDADKFAEEVERIVGTAAKADTIAHRTAKHITEKMEEDPAFYKRFSDMLKEAIQAYKEKRISEAEYLKRAKEIEEAIIHRTDSSIPVDLNNRFVAQAFYGISFEAIKDKFNKQDMARRIAVDMGLSIDDLIRDLVLDNDTPKVDWQYKSNLIGQLKIAIGDFLIDIIKQRYDLSLSFGEIDQIVYQIVEVAKRRY